jgi:NhaP-type Na+/H+ or K+/H+ antiporter
LIPLREIDLLGVFISPALICLVVALVISLVLRRLLDKTDINRFVWNRALFDLSLLVAITALLILSLRFGGSCRCRRARSSRQPLSISSRP